MAYIALGKDFIREVEVTCTHTLVGLGMRKRTIGLLTYPIDRDFQGWVGLNAETRTGDGSMIVNPNIGVRCNPIHRIVSIVKGYKYHQYHPPTIGTGIGYLMPQRTYVPFVFRKGEPVQPLAEVISENIRKYGVHYIQDNSTLDRIIERLWIEATIDEGGERLLAAYYLKGSLADFETVIERQLDRLHHGMAKNVNYRRLWESLIRGFDEYVRNFRLCIMRGELDHVAPRLPAKASPPPS